MGKDIRSLFCPIVYSYNPEKSVINALYQQFTPFSFSSFSHGSHMTLIYPQTLIPPPQVMPLGENLIIIFITRLFLM